MVDDIRRWLQGCARRITQGAMPSQFLPNSGSQKQTTTTRKPAAWVQIHPYAISTILDFLWAGPDLRPANGSPADLHDSVVEAVRMSGMPRPRRRHDVIEPVVRIPAEQSASMVSIGVQGHGIAGSAGREFVGHRTSDRLFR